MPRSSDSSVAHRLRVWWWSRWARVAILVRAGGLAIRCLERVLRLEPRRNGARLQIAALAAALGDPRRAEAEVADALAIDPADGEAHVKLGILLDQREAWHEAEISFRAGLAHDAGLYRGWYGLGMCLIKQGRLAEALHPLEQCTRCQPDYPNAWYQLARVHHDLGHGGEARRLAQRLEGMAPRAASHLRREFELSAAFGGVAFPQSDRSPGWR